MFSRRWSTWLACAVLALYALTGLAPGRGLVLCIGPGGHWALEVASAGWNCLDCVTDAPSEADCCGSESTHDAQDCRCADIPLVGNDSKRATARVQIGVPPPLPLAFAADVLPPSISERILARTLDQRVRPGARMNPVLRI
jgi:hypothetical protein